MLRSPLISLCAILALASVAQGAEEIYRWVDESGGVHFGDEPPSSGAADVQAMELEIARGTLYSKIKKYRLKNTAPSTTS